jgi:4-amino-4-deoxy-L-arabinose transferase-like glycosyltransferase
LENFRGEFVTTEFGLTHFGKRERIGGNSSQKAYRNNSSLILPLLSVALMAFALRVIFRWYSGEEDFWTNGYPFYFDLAQNIASGNISRFDDGYPLGFRVPMYAAFLALVTLGHKEFISILMFQSAIGAGTVCCAALIARELFGGAAAIIAALVTAIYPYYVVHDTALQDTSLYTFLTAGSVLLLLKADRSGSSVTGAFAGLTLGFLVLTRATLAPFAIFAPIWLAFAHDPRMGICSRRVWVALLCLSAAALVVSPWLIRSYLLIGSPVLSSEAGLLLWAGNNPYTFSHYPAESIDISKHTALEELSLRDKAEIKAMRNDEAALDRWFLMKGLRYIHEDPDKFIRSAFRKVGAAFGPLPSPRKGPWANAVHLFSYGSVMMLGLAGFWAHRTQWRQNVIFYALFAFFVVVTGIFYGHTSHRAYLDVYLIIFAAAFLQWWQGPLPLFDRFCLFLNKPFSEKKI